MYLYFDPVLVYGILEPEYENYILDETWLDEHYNKINIFARSIVKNFMTDACYGIPCSIKDDKFVISEEEKKMVDDLYNYLNTKYPNKEYKLGYHLVIYGDYSLDCHTTYTMDEE